METKIEIQMIIVFILGGFFLGIINLVFLTTEETKNRMSKGISYNCKFVFALLIIGCIAIRSLDFMVYGIGFALPLLLFSCIGTLIGNIFLK
jgi:hypothetical protein